MEERLKILRKKVDDLLQWKSINEEQQITLSSYGKNSIDIVNKNQLVATGRIDIPFESSDIWIGVTFDKVLVYFPAKIVV